MFAPRNENKDFEQCPTGWQLGVCSRVIDVGTHFNPGKQKDQRKIMIAFESQHLMKEGDFAGEPFLLFGNFNYSMYQNAHLCQFIENWRGRRFKDQDEADRFDLSKLIGQKAFMNVVRSEDGRFTNIQTIGPVPEGMAPPEVKGKTILIDQANLDPKEVEKLSDKMRERVMSAKEQTEGSFHQAQQISHDRQQNTMRADSENPGEGLASGDAGFNDDLPF